MQTEILAPNPGADLKVYSVWFNMYPGDRKSRWNPDLLNDPRVTHFWDQDKRVGGWMVENQVVDYPGPTLWDSYLLFEPDATWNNQPAPLIGWGMPVYHRRHKLRSELQPFLATSETEGGSEPAEIAREAGVGAALSGIGTEQYDLMVIGGGGAGFAAAIQAAEMGKRAAIVESGTLGGVCVNVGCVPSKTLLKLAALNHLGSGNPYHGAVRIQTALNWTGMMAAKNELVAQMQTSRYRDVLRAYENITLLRGRATLLGGTEVSIRLNGELGTISFSPGKVIIATGSNPWAPPIEGLARVSYLDSSAALDLERQPRSMMVLGASSVGLEIAQAFSRLGTRITVIELQDTILPMEDSEISGDLTDNLREEGISIETDVQAHRVEQRGGQIHLFGSRLGEDLEFTAEALLVATGRRPHTADLGLDAAGIAVGSHGEVVVDHRLQTSNPNIYAAGDVIGGAMFVYVAAYAGKLAALNALGRENQSFEVDPLPRVTFTDPAVASVGLTEEQAYENGHQVKVSSLPLEFVSRAQTNGDTRGLIKLVADKTTDRLLGAHVLSAEAGEVIQAATIALHAGMTVHELQTLLFPYLTMVEGLKLAALSFDKDPAMLSCCAG